MSPLLQNYTPKIFLLVPMTPNFPNEKITKDHDNAYRPYSATSAIAKSVRASSRKNRVYVFRDFLLQTYGSHIQANKNGLILDVAGGKGDLSWILLNADGIRSVVIDPRALSCSSHLIRSIRWLEEHPPEAEERAVPNRPSHQPLAALLPQILERKRQRLEDRSVDEDSDAGEFIEPKNLQTKLDDNLVEALRRSMKEDTAAAGQCPETWRTFWESQLPQTKHSTTNGTTEPCFLPESERHKRMPKPPVQDALEAWEIFQSVRLIAGFHPDQATEACVDLADLLQVPLCIVPCCVFPSEFPDRKLILESAANVEKDNCNDDEKESTISVRVRDYETFLQYLQQKQPKLRKDTLAFHQTETSRNIVLYTLPEDLHPGTSNVCT